MLTLNKYDSMIYLTDVYIPTCVRSLSSKQIISISCGEEHTATLSKVSVLK